MVFFMGLKVDVKTKISPFACSTACSSLRPTIESGGMLQSRKEQENRAKGKETYYYSKFAMLKSVDNYHIMYSLRFVMRMELYLNTAQGILL